MSDENEIDKITNKLNFTTGVLAATARLQTGVDAWVETGFGPNARRFCHISWYSVTLVVTSRSEIKFVQNKLSEI